MLTAQRCLAVFGDPLKMETHFMTVFDVPADLEIGFIPKKIYCNKQMVGPLTQAFRNLVRTGEIKYLKSWDGCFNIRKKRGSSSPSLHSWGLAIDINAAWNGFGKPPNLRPQFVKCFTNAGFDWGGDWTKPDGMHFQLKDI